MLRGLAIRQALILVEWVLVLLAILGACFLGLRAVGVVKVGAKPSLAEAVADASAPTQSLALAGPRPQYDGIVKSGLFGASGDVPPVVPQVETKKDAPETGLQLKLCGTTATSPRDPYASAVIQKQDNSVVTVGVGQAIDDKAKLVEVYPRKVIIFNKSTNQNETLKSEEAKESEAASQGGQASGPGGAAVPSAPNRVTLKKQELVQDLFMNYTDIVSQIKPEMYKDANGNVAGITASNLGSVAIAQKLGIKDGDVLQTVNNEVIDSEEKILEMVNKYRNSNTFRIGILRDGRPQVITYRLE